jgi:hypothetical protein
MLRDGVWRDPEGLLLTFININGCCSGITHALLKKMLSLFLLQVKELFKHIWRLFLKHLGGSQRNHEEHYNITLSSEVQIGYLPIKLLEWKLK